LSVISNDELRADFIKKRSTYDEPLFGSEQLISVELLSGLLDKMKNGKAVT